MAIAYAWSVYARRLLKEKVDWAKGLIWKQSFQTARTTLLERCSSHLSSFQCSSAGDFLVTHALAAHDRRTADLAASSCAHLALWQKNSWKWIQLQQEHTNSQELMAKATDVSCKSLRPAVPSPNHPQKHVTSWRHSRAPHRRSTANYKRSRSYHSFKQRLTLQTRPVWTRKHESEGKGHIHTEQSLVLRRRQPLRRKSL